MLVVGSAGFREVEPLTGAGKVFTIVFILAGVGTALSTVGAVFEFVVEGALLQLRRRKRMDRSIAQSEEVEVVEGSPLCGRSLDQCAIRETTGALVLARCQG